MREIPHNPAKNKIALTVQFVSVMMPRTKLRDFNPKAHALGLFLI